MNDNFELELWRGDEWLAGASGTKADAEREIMHYAMVYLQDGPVEIKRVVREPYSVSHLILASAKAYSSAKQG